MIYNKINDELVILHQWLDGKPKYISQDLISYIFTFFRKKHENQYKVKLKFYHSLKEIIWVLQNTPNTPNTQNIST